MAEYGARDDANAKGMQRVVDELLEKARLHLVLFPIYFLSGDEMPPPTFTPA